MAAHVKSSKSSQALHCRPPILFEQTNRAAEVREGEGHVSGAAAAEGGGLGLGLGGGSGAGGGGAPAIPHRAAPGVDPGPSAPAQTLHGFLCPVLAPLAPERAAFPRSRLS